MKLAPIRFSFVSSLPHSQIIKFEELTGQVLIRSTEENRVSVVIQHLYTVHVRK